MSEWKDPVRKLALLVQGQAETSTGLIAEQHVMALALAALVRSHPDPQGFAQEFRRAWQRAGDPLAKVPADSAEARHIESVLEVLEESCAAPLNVRAPGVAQPPDH